MPGEEEMVDETEEWTVLILNLSYWQRQRILLVLGVLVVVV